MSTSEFDPNNKNIRHKLPHAGGENVPEDVRETPAREFGTPLDEAVRQGHMEAPDTVAKGLEDQPLTDEEADRLQKLLDERKQQQAAGTPPEYPTSTQIDTREPEPEKKPRKGLMAVGAGVAAVAVGAAGYFGLKGGDDKEPLADPTRPVATAPVKPTPSAPETSQAPSTTEAPSPSTSPETKKGTGEFRNPNELKTMDPSAFNKLPRQDRAYLAWEGLKDTVKKGTNRLLPPGDTIREDIWMNMCNGYPLNIDKTGMSQINDESMGMSDQNIMDAIACKLQIGFSKTPDEVDEQGRSANTFTIDKPEAKNSISGLVYYDNPDTGGLVYPPSFDGYMRTIDNNDQTPYVSWRYEATASTKLKPDQNGVLEKNIKFKMHKNSGEVEDGTMTVTPFKFDTPEGEKLTWMIKKDDAPDNAFPNAS